MDLAVAHRGAGTVTSGVLATVAVDVIVIVDVDVIVDEFDDRRRAGRCVGA